MADGARHNGDRGRTSLGDGTPVHKDSPVVEAYGVFDELDAFAGAARARIMADISPGPQRDLLIDAMDLTQKCAWLTGASLACPGSRPALDPEVLLSEIDSLCGRFEDVIGPVRGFVLPGVTSVEAALHVARTVCRRAERRTVALGLDADGRDAPWQCALANRLSTLLFFAAMFSLKAQGHEPRYRQ